VQQRDPRRRRLTVLALLLLVRVVLAWMKTIKEVVRVAAVVVLVGAEEFSRVS
jgi:hypothetical protein